MSKRPGDEDDETEIINNCEKKSKLQHGGICQGIYMDYQATTPLEEEVVSTISQCLKEAWGNPSSSYLQGKIAKEKIDEARLWIAEMINTNKTNILFTSGGTESNNMILHTALKNFHKTFCSKKEIEAKHKYKPHIVTSNIEHDSVTNVLRNFEKEGLADVTFVKVSTRTGRVEVDAILEAIRPTTCMVTIMMVNNETGIIQPISDISQAVKSLSRNPEKETDYILIHTDAAQALGKIPVDVTELGVDYLTIVGHKFYGPRIGALYWSSYNEKIPLYPLIYGGGQEQGLRSGTENTPMIAGLGKAAELVCLNLDSYTSHMRTVRDYLESRLHVYFGEDIVINGKFENSERTANVCNVSFPNSGCLGHEILARCKHLQASVGAACHSDQHHKPSPILLAIGVPCDIAKSAIRLSIGRQTTTSDIDIVVKDLIQACGKQ